MTGSIAIKLEHVSKDFRVYHEKTTTLRDQITSNIFGRNKYETLHILQDISFEATAGEMIGLIGKNGAGKTTLLRIIAGIMKPTSGNVITNGKLIPFLGLGVGFNQNLSAIDNIMIYGMILGFGKKEILERVPWVLEYAELQRFGDTAIRNFSSGMHARLAFSTAILVDPDILIVDEVLAVGDIGFKEKSYNTFMEMKKKKKTIVLVSHSLKQIGELCDKVILLHEGRVEAMGDPKSVIARYVEMYGASKGRPT